MRPSDGGAQDVQIDQDVRIDLCTTTAQYPALNHLSVPASIPSSYVYTRSMLQQETPSIPSNGNAQEVSIDLSVDDAVTCHAMRSLS